MVYSDIIISNKLYGYLANKDIQARAKLDQFVVQISRTEDI